MSVRNDSGPYRVVRDNLYPAAELQGDTVHGYSSGQSLQSMEQLADELLPEGFAFDWTELAYQQDRAAIPAPSPSRSPWYSFSCFSPPSMKAWSLPLAVILIVPMCLLAAVLGVNVMGLDNNILSQIGLVVLIGLAAKNAILIVEFARQNEEAGQERHAAARHAAGTPSSAHPDDLDRFHSRHPAAGDRHRNRAPKCARRWGLPSFWE